MKQLTIVLFFLVSVLATAKNYELPNDAIIHKNKKIVVDDSNNDIKIDIFSIKAAKNTT